MDEVSDDFLLEAFTVSRKQKEWPSCKHIKPARYARDGWRSSAIQLMISECQRLILEWIPKEEIYHTYPLNMPELNITVIELVGTILRLTQTYNYLQLHVYDGTGIMTVNYDLEQYEEVKKNRLKIDKNFRLPPELLKYGPRFLNKLTAKKGSSLYEQHQRWRYWWTVATREGLYGKELKVGDYVNVFGCVKLASGPELKPKTPWDIGVLPKIELLADHVDVIDEKTYANKFDDFIDRGQLKYATETEEETAESEVITVDSDSKGSDSKGSDCEDSDCKDIETN